MEADDYPRATHTLDGIQRLIRELENKGYAYTANGDVYYTVRQFPQYGKLSRRKLDDMQAGASGRLQGDDKKKDPFDFALWKSAKPGEPAWDSPWGSGRPGWHIECSAMVRDRLGETIDIHCGGADLMFPHHENEIAQSEAATGHPLANYWMHNGMVTVNGEKMSKSLGNFTTIRTLLDRPVEPMALRLFVLQAHYRKPLDFTEEAIASAENSWMTLVDGLRFGKKYGTQLGWQTDAPPEPDSASVEQFNAAMDHDFNTPGGLAVLFELAKNLRREGNIIVHQGSTETDPEVLYRQWYTLVQLAGVLGLEVRAEQTDETDAGGLSDGDIESLIEQRKAARKSRNFAEADRIRDELQAQGIALIDKPGGATEWCRQ
jgi:cysteinyl-tRNA synthetase